LFLRAVIGVSVVAGLFYFSDALLFTGKWLFIGGATYYVGRQLFNYVNEFQSTKAKGRKAGPGNSISEYQEQTYTPPAEQGRFEKWKFYAKLAAQAFKGYISTKRDFANLAVAIGTTVTNYVNKNCVRDVSSFLLSCLHLRVLGRVSCRTRRI
jgi:hypothetical protein